jgi:gliding motility-associated-like protein
MKTSTCFKIAILCLLFLIPSVVKAQLDLIHYVPPLYAGSTNESDIEDHWVVLTTPSENPIEITIKRGDGTLFQKVSGVSINSPKKVSLNEEHKGTLTNPPLGVVNYTSLNKVISDQGLIFTSTEAFYVNIRHKSEIHGLSLTSKGQVALGTSFRSGHLHSVRGENKSGWGGQYYDSYRDRWRSYGTHIVDHRSHFISVMATEDNTVVTFSDIKVGNLTSDSRKALPVADITTDVNTAKSVSDYTDDGVFNVILNKGDSYVLGANHEFLTPDDINKFNGTKISSDKPIAVNSGSWCGSASTSNKQDIGVDQIVPEKLVGNEYIILKGQGNEGSERPVVVATQDNTNIFVNGIAGKINKTPLNAGDSYAIEIDYFNKEEGTMLIKTDQNVYMYQTTAASKDKPYPTIGMNFIPPLSFLGFRQVDIPFINELGTGIVAIYAQKNIDVFVNNSDTPLDKGTAKLVAGKDEWVVYEYSTSDKNVSVKSDKAIYVALSVFDNVVGAAGYFSGFTKSISPVNPKVVFDYDLGYICSNKEGYLDLKINSTPIPDWYEWYHDIIHPDSIKNPNENLFVPVPKEATKYILKAYFRDPNMDILYNGDFAIGRGRFESDFDFNYISRLDDPGKATLCANPQSVNSRFSTFEDVHVDPNPAGKMLLAHSSGSGNSEVLWSKTITNSIDIPNHLFILKMYGRLAHEIDDKYSEQDLNIFVNDEKINTQTIKLDKTDTWKSIKLFWRADKAESAKIEIVDANATGKQSVFAIDSISFVPAVEAIKEFNPDVVPSYSYTPYDKGLHLCKGAAQGVANIKFGDMEWFTFLWEKKIPGEKTFAPINDASISGLDTYELKFNNVVDNHAGIYRCTIDFKKTYEQCGIDVDPTSVKVEVFVDETASFESLKGTIELCEGDPSKVSAIISGDFSVIKWSVFRKDEATVLEVKENNSNTFLFNQDGNYVAGDYIVRCEVINGCSEDLFKEIDIKILGKAKLKSLTVPTNLCEIKESKLEAILEGEYPPVGSKLEYFWYKNGNSIPMDSTYVPTYNTTPNINDLSYKVKLNTHYNFGETNQFTCEGIPIEESLVGNPIDPEIILSIKSEPICEGLTHTFLAELETASDSYTYDWDVTIAAQVGKVPADFTSNSFGLGPVSLDMDGDYTVTVKNNCDDKSATSTLTVNPKLLVTGVTLSPVGPYCLNDIVTVTVNDNDHASAYLAKNLRTDETRNSVINSFTIKADALTEGQWQVTALNSCGNKETSFTIDLTDSFSPPTIAPRLACVGELVKLNAVVETPPVGIRLTYLWKDQSGTVITDETSSTLVFNPVKLTDAGEYTCVVSDGICSTQQAIGTLSVDDVDIETLKPTTANICEGDPHRFVFSSDGNPTFAWFFKGADNKEINLGITTDSFYEISSVSIDDDGLYYCIINSACGEKSFEQELNVLKKVIVTEKTLASIDICEGEQTILSINVTGSYDSIKWFKDGALLSQDGSQIISTGILSDSGTFIYKYVVDGEGDCFDPEGTFEVIVHAKPSITPIDQINSCSGDVNLNMLVTSVDLASSSWWNFDESSKLKDGTIHTLSGMTYSGKSIDYIAATNTAFCKDFVTAIASVYIFEPISLVAKSTITPTVCEGTDLDLVVEGKGSNLIYKWSKGGVPLADPTNPSIFNLSNLNAATDFGVYRCDLSSDESCNTDLVEFTVTILKNATITHPKGISICEDLSTSNFIVSGTGEGVWNYQWYDNNVVMSSEKNETLTVANSLGNNNHYYKCKIENSTCRQAESKPAHFEVKQRVGIRKEPQDITIAENGKATFTIDAVGTDLHYQWYDGATPIGGEESNTLTIEPALFWLNGHEYKCKVSNTCLSVEASAILTVDKLLKITSQPVDHHVCEGTNVDFVVKHVALTAGKICFWEYNDGSSFKRLGGLAGHTVVESADKSTSTLKISNPQSVLNGYLYRVIVEGLISPDDDDVSNVVKLTVDHPAEFSIIGDTKICKDAGASFNVDVTSGSTPYTYEWERDGVTIGTKGINSNLNLAATVAIDKPYSVGVTAGVCPAVNKGFSISYYDDLDLKDLVHANSLCPGDNINLIVGIKTGSAVSTTYTWTKNGFNIGKDPTYEFTEVSDEEKGLYRVEVKDKCMTQSKSIKIDVLDIITKTDVWESEPLCVGDNLSLEAKVTGNTPSYTWKLPAGSTRVIGDVSNLKIDALLDTDAGTYECSVKGECGDAVVYTINIVVNDAPNITAGLEGLGDICINKPLSLGPILYDATGESIIWKFKDVVQTGKNRTSLDLGIATLVMEGNYRVEVTNACGTDFSLGYLDVHPLPILDPIDDQIACQGENVIFRAVTKGENLNYSWLIDGAIDHSFDNKTEFIIPNVQPFDENTLGVHSIKCIVSSSCGPDLPATANVTVYPNTILKKSIKGDVVYVGEDYTFSLDVTGSDLRYEWHHINTVDKDKEIVTAKTKTLSIDNLSMADAGEYYCIITGDCGVRFTSGVLTVKDPMKIVDGLNNLTDIEKCFGEPLNLNISVDGEVFSIKWYKNDEPLGYDGLHYSIPSLDISDSGNYRCEIKGEGADITEVVNVRVYETTVLKSHLTDITLCELEDLQWIPNVSGSLLIYDWKYNGVSIPDLDPKKATLEIDKLKMEQVGIYSVGISGKCGDVFSEANLSLKKLPFIKSKSDDENVCENYDEIVFSVVYGGDNLEYQWQKDNIDLDGANSSEYKLQNIRVSDAGEYKCIVSSSCDITGKQSVMKLEVTPQLKILSESPGMEICDGENAQFLVEVKGTDTDYQWQKDGVVLPGEKSPQLMIDPASLKEEGYYNCEISDKCTKGIKRYSNSKKLKVNALPTSKINGRMILCVLEDRVAYNTDVIPNNNYGWLVQGGEFTSPADGLRTKITWGDTDLDGMVKLKIMNDATGCYSEVDSLVKLRPLPDVKLTALETRGICESEFELSGGFPAGGIYWVNGVSQNTFDPSQGNGEYQVRYSYTDDLGCSNSTGDFIMKVDSLPIVKIIEDVVVGSCETRMLSAETEENNIKWSPSRYLDDPNSETPTFKAGETTLYVATVVDKFGCVGNDIVNVTVAPLPTITTISDTIIGECKEIELTTIISGDIEDITWTNASDLDNFKNSNPKLIERHLGVNDYQINVTDEYGCVASGSIQVEVLPNPEVGESQFLCEGETLLVDTKDLSNPVWSDGYTAWERTIDKPGEYELSVEQNDCKLKQRIVMNPLPKFELDNTIQPGIVIFEGETLTLDPELDPDYGPYVYDWSDGSILPQLVVSESGTYKLSVEDNIGCIAIDTVDVQVKPIGIESPNAFTPLSNNENDHFYLKDINVIDKFEMYIYNRWGELMYQTNEPGYANGWDGTYKGEDCSVGAYVWVVMLDGEIKEKGTVILVR